MPLAYVSGSPISLEELLKRDRSLVDQSLHAREGATTTNGDGFGVGWYDEGETPKVRSHAHALRAAFAVRFDEAHPDQLLALKDTPRPRPSRDDARLPPEAQEQLAMERVRDLSWGA